MNAVREMHTLTSSLDTVAAAADGDDGEGDNSNSGSSSSNNHNSNHNHNNSCSVSDAYTNSIHTATTNTTKTTTTNTTTINADVCCMCNHTCNGCKHHVSLTTEAIPHSLCLRMAAVVPFLAVLPQERGNIFAGESQIVNTTDTYTHTNNTVEAYSDLSPEYILTREEMCKTLLLCGVKRHRCAEAVLQLWEYFLLLCYNNNNHNHSNNHNNINNNNNNNASLKCSCVCGCCCPRRASHHSHIMHTTEKNSKSGDFALVVRHTSLRHVKEQQQQKEQEKQKKEEKEKQQQRGRRGRVRTSAAHTTTPRSSSVIVGIEELMAAANAVETTPLPTNTNTNTNTISSTLSTTSTTVGMGIGKGMPKYTIVISKSAFDRCVARLLSRELRGRSLTVCPLPRWSTAQSIVQHRRPLVLFCGGTSGCGKSTLASLISTHLGIDTLLSTDTIRQALRRTLRREAFPELFFSTYEAHKARGGNRNNNNNSNSDNNKEEGEEGREETDEVLDSQMIIEAYEKQCDTILRVLDGMLEKIISRREAVVVEGVHLLTTYMQRKCRELQARGIMCVPFLICITKEQRHMERFCTRAKCMTLSPQRNKYVSHFRHIRLIQQHLLEQAHACNVNIVNNTNIDISLMYVHAHLLDCMDHGINISWDKKPNKEVVALDSSTPANCITNTSSVEWTSSSLSHKDAEEHILKSEDVIHRTFADPNISGKRMLALLLKWRREKKKRWARNNTNSMNEFQCESCLATSLLTQTTRSRSAESLTSFRLQSLAMGSRISDVGNETLMRTVQNSRTPYNMWSSSEAAIVSECRDEKDRVKCNTAANTWIKPTKAEEKYSFLQNHQQQEQEHLLLPFVSSLGQSHSKTIHTVTDAPTFPSNNNNNNNTNISSINSIAASAAFSRKDMVFRSASAGAVDGEDEMDCLLPRGKKHKRSTKCGLCPWRAFRRAQDLTDEKEEEWDTGSRCEFPSLMGS